MERVISFALGNVWSWTTLKNPDVLVDYVRDLDVSGIELTIARKEALYQSKFSETNLHLLNGLDYVSIHAPFKLIEKSESKEEVIKQLDIISRMYEDTKAKTVVIHPNNLPEPEILEKYSFNVSTENLTPRANVTISDLEEVFKKYPKIGLCLDVAHAYLWSKHETGRLVNAFRERISQVHFSGTYRKKDHQSLRKVSKDFLFSIQPLRELDVPIVIEEDIKIQSLEFVKEEISYIKELLNTIY